ncbi:MAG TPA: aminotransferase class III-fold pyridoxal phosphate-dependent enzyme [Bryobacteraceae bacterium]|jgi:taurine---2-oxoglutarate transaminase|nr:aminotransferase class III-fold pyridoxal phosphate-dependent enzyme [Bryobacteraceae bacterium]
MAQPQISSTDVAAVTRQTNYGTWRYQKTWKPLHIADAEGCYIIDAEGKRYLDFSAQLMCVNLGHKNPAVVEAIAEQARKLCYVSPAHTTAPRAELSRLLLEILPQGLTKFFLVTSGTEANEAAMKIARMYTGRSKILSRYRSYHGSTMASIAVTGEGRRWAAEPSAKGANVVFGPEVNCYDCPIKHSYPSCGVACADYMEHIIANENDVAAVIVEPVVGTNGVLVPPPEYLPKLRRICDDHGVLLIADEVMSGWGRTGEWFAVNHWNVKPDILVTAKGITSAYIPLGLCATTQKIADYFEDHFFAHGHTYEAHPLTLLPAIATIHEMRRLDLVNRAREVGKYLGEKLTALKDRHPSVGDVRGLGMFWAVELVKNRATKQLFNTMQEKMAGMPAMVDKIAAEMMKNGVSVSAWISHFVIAPPLIIEKSEIDQGVAAMDAALRLADEQVQ